MKVELPVEHCGDCGVRLMPTTWWADVKTGGGVCVNCVKRLYADGRCRKVSANELAHMATRRGARVS